MHLVELRKMAKEQGIKYICKQSKLDLAKNLGLDPNIVCAPINKQSYFKRPSKEIYITNINTGEKVICTSMYKCGKLLNKNCGSIYHFLTTGNALKIGDDYLKITYA